MRNKYHKFVDFDEEKVVVWDDTMKIYVVKFKRDVKLRKNKRILWATKVDGSKTLKGIFCVDQSTHIANLGLDSWI